MSITKNRNNIMQDHSIDWEDIQKDRFLKDPEAKDRWEKMAMARVVAIAVIRYRAKHGLSQMALARKLGVPRSYIARLELGEHNPSVETLRWFEDDFNITKKIARINRALLN